FPNMLYGAIKRAEYPHARIIAIDTSAAEAMRGVAGVITHKDIPLNRYGPKLQDQPVLADDRVRYTGDPVAALAAESEELARDALEKIKVTYEELPPVLDPFEALKPETIKIHPNHPTGNLVLGWKIRKGDVEAGFREADLILEEKYNSFAQEHASIEPHVCVAEADHRGKITVHATTQRPFLFRSDLSRVLRLPIPKVRVIPATMGGGFGGKHEIVQEAPAAIFALRTGRPVKFRFSREDEFIASTVRHTFYMTFKTGVRRDGTITASEIEFVSDGGPYTSWGETTLSKAALMGAGPYRVPNLKLDALLVYTNNCVAGAVRGFGVTQSTFGCESHMDSLAEKLGMDPKEFRVRNSMRPGDKAHSGDPLSSCAVVECIEAASEAVGWGKPLPYRPAGPHKRYGRGIASMIYPVGFTAYHNPSSAFVRINEDASITVWSGCADCGQGSNVALAQIAAEELGIPFESVLMVTRDTDLVPYDLGSVASRVTHIGGNAVRRAARSAKEKLLSVAADMLEAAPEDLVPSDGMICVKGAPGRAVTLGEVARHSYASGKPLIAEGVYDPGDVHLDPETGQGRPYDCYVFASHVADVEVDVETGEVKVLRLAAAHDV
ncbi:MAG: xanthine dehydrogenase family protein molybdopterin-binding subunit, partial [Candidatus Bipolaricaulia bacterium]